MKTVYLLRHAKTEVQQQGQSDFDRQLIERGRNNAAEIAKQIKDKKIIPDKLLSSPAARAIATARIFATKLHFSESKIEQNSLIYNASVITLIKIIQSLEDESKIVFIVGHNPGMTQLSNFLCLPPILHIPTSGVVCIEFDEKHWRDVNALSGKQKFFIYP